MYSDLSGSTLELKEVFKSGSVDIELYSNRRRADISRWIEDTAQEIEQDRKRAPKRDLSAAECAPADSELVARALLLGLLTPCHGSFKDQNS